MAKQSFARKPEAPTEETENPAEGQDHSPEETGVATQEGAGELAHHSSTASVVGDLDPDDLNSPRLNCCNPLSKGELSPGSGRFKLGDLALDRTVKLGASNVPMNCIILQIEKTWEENLPYSEDVQKRRFASAEAAVAEGFSLMYDDKKSVTRRADVRMLVEIRPDATGTSDLDHDDPDRPSKEDLRAHAESMGIFDIGGKLYAPAVATFASSSAYTAGAKPIFSAANRQLREMPLYSGKFAIKSKDRRNAKGEWWVIEIAYRGAFSPEELKIIREIAQSMGFND